MILRPIFRAKVINLAESVPEKAIAVSNHASKMGPASMEFNYPVYNVKWGAHEMLEGYGSRFRYLRDVLYMQKHKNGKLRATLKAAFEAIFSPAVYRGLKFIPTYTDLRLRHTISQSIDVLDDGGTVMIFPEDSSNGYFDELKSLHTGFVLLALQYRTKRSEDLPVIPSYYHRRKRLIIIGKPLYVGALYDTGMTIEEIAELFRGEINSLGAQASACYP